MGKIVLYCSESLRILLHSVTPGMEVVVQDEERRKQELSGTCYIILITLKALLCFMIALFFLFMPLGDPNKVCPPTVSSHPYVCEGFKPNYYAIFGYHCLCDVYQMLTKAIINIGVSLQRLIRYLWNLILNTLYNIKLSIYHYLDVVDREDLCKSLHCSVTTMPAVCAKRSKTNNGRKCKCGCRL